MNRILLLVVFFTALISCRKEPVKPGNQPDPPKPPVTEVSQTGLVTTSINFPATDSTFTITFDPAKGNAGLAGFSGDVYMHMGTITNLSNSAADWRHVRFDWTTNNPVAKMTRQSNGKYTISINPRSYFTGLGNETVQKLAMVFRSADGTLVGRNIDGTDIYIPIYNNSSVNVRFLEPEIQPTFDPKPVINVSGVGQELTVTGTSSQKANLSLTLNGASFATASSVTQIKGKAAITTSGLQTVKIIANGSTEATFTFLIGGAAVVEALPTNAKIGVTYLNGGSSAIFALYAPNKQYVNVIGDFNNWTPTSFMKKTPDGNIWWIQLDNLNANTEYSYQYLIDGNLKVADPYSEKILDPSNDQYIPAANNANFGVYPAGKTTGIVSTMKGNQTIYNWQNSFTRPVKTDLVIYELHLRDFLGANNYATLKDTLNYLSRLGVNAIELMPVTEFEGNSSWGYNPSFYFAADKYYGNKQALQQFIDQCHGKGIAVILDMVLNHSFGQNPMVQMYFDGTKPVNSPWFNSTPTHPYNVGYDFNHESVHTKTFVKNVLKFWMQEYKIDGFRFDLSKGFTQTKYGTGDAAVGPWSNYDAGRVAIWKDYNNYIKSIDPNNFYVILEHFAADQEEKELSVDGMMLWNNLNYNFNEASMGWLNNSNFQRGIYSTHSFTQPDNLVTYMESHDEERMMFKNLAYGNSSGSYNVKDLNTALKRQEMCAAFLFAMPGPKMIWQFGELGYDVSIDQNGRTGEKPLHWEYNTQPNRIALRNAFARFISLKKKNTIFRTTNITYNFAGAIKYIKLVEGAKTVVVIGNFDVNNQSASIDFGAAGVWYDAANANHVMTLGSNSYSANLAPGEYHIFSNTVLSE